MDSVIPLVAFGLAGAGVNMYAGHEDGDRYTAGAALAVFGLFIGWAAAAAGLALILWRLIGWNDSIDMGRDEGSFADDFFRLALISSVPAIVVWAAASNHLPITLAITLPLCYAAAMRLLPYKPGIPHIRIAEGLSGFVLAATAYLAV